jgi:hypothetical protein
VKCTLFHGCVFASDLAASRAICARISPIDRYGESWATLRHARTRKKTGRTATRDDTRLRITPSVEEFIVLDSLRLALKVKVTQLPLPVPREPEVDTLCVELLVSFLRDFLLTHCRCVTIMSTIVFCKKIWGSLE